MIGTRCAENCIPCPEKLVDLKKLPAGPEVPGDPGVPVSLCHVPDIKRQNPQTFNVVQNIFVQGKWNVAFDLVASRKGDSKAR
eukprot:2162892-Rhodomonas_salina.1